MPHNAQESVADLRAVIHALRMGGFAYVEPEALSHIQSMIKQLPVPEELEKMQGAPETVQKVRDAVGFILAQVDHYGQKNPEYKARFESRKNLPPRYKVLDWKPQKDKVASTMKNFIKASAECEHFNINDSDQLLVIAEKLSDILDYLDENGNDETTLSDKFISYQKSLSHYAEKWMVPEIINAKFLVDVSAKADDKGFSELSEKSIKMAENIMGDSVNHCELRELSRELREAGLFDFIQNRPGALTRQREKAKQEKTKRQRQQNKEYERWFKEFPPQLEAIKQHLVLLGEIAQNYTNDDGTSTYETIYPNLNSLYNTVDGMLEGLEEGRDQYISGEEWGYRTDPQSQPVQQTEQQQSVSEERSEERSIDHTITALRNDISNNSIRQEELESIWDYSSELLQHDIDPNQLRHPENRYEQLLKQLSNTGRVERQDLIRLNEIIQNAIRNINNVDQSELSETQFTPPPLSQT